MGLMCLLAAHLLRCQSSLYLHLGSGFLISCFYIASVLLWWFLLVGRRRIVFAPSSLCAWRLLLIIWTITNILIDYSLSHDIYIYIYIERERERERFVCYFYINIFSQMWSLLTSPYHFLLFVSVSLSLSLSHTHTHTYIYMFASILRN